MGFPVFMAPKVSFFVALFLIFFLPHFLSLGGKDGGDFFLTGCDIGGLDDLFFSSLAALGFGVFS